MRVCSSSRDEADRPSTPTIAAMPMATPSVDSPVRSRRVRRPSAPTRKMSAGRSRDRYVAVAALIAAAPVGLPPTASSWASSIDSIEPSRIETRRGSDAASSRSWVMMRIVRPSAWSSRSRSITAPPDRESRLPVGSSARTIDGRLTMALAMATRWRSPPDIWLGVCVSRWPRPTRPRASAAASRRSTSVLPRYSSPLATLSSAVIPSSRKNDWKTNPMRCERTPESCRSLICDVSMPATRTVPLDGRSRVPMMCSRVDLPEPDGPTIAASSPLRTSSDTESRARTGG